MKKSVIKLINFLILSRHKEINNPKSHFIEENFINDDDLYSTEYFFNDELVEQTTTNISDIEPLEISLLQESNTGKKKSLSKLLLSKLEKIIIEFKPLDLYRFLKDNITILAILIPSLGASIQIIELSFIHISYLRYFSATQLASDGAIVSLILIPIFIGSGIIIQMLRYLVKESVKESDEQLTRLQIISLFTILTITYLVMDIIIRGNIGSEPISYLIVSIGMLFSLVGFMVISYVQHREILNRGYQDKRGIVVTRLSSVLMLINCIVIFMSAILLVDKYLEMYRIPYNFDNQKILQEQILLDYKGIKVEGFKLLYFNDKYTLVEINSPDTGNTIRVYKTDDVLFSPSSRKVYLN